MGILPIPSQSPPQIARLCFLQPFLLLCFNWMGKRVFNGSIDIGDIASVGPRHLISLETYLDHGECYIILFCWDQSS